MTAPSVRLTLDTYADGADGTMLQARWSGSYVSTARHVSIPDPIRLAARLTGALRCVEEAVAINRREEHNGEDTGRVTVDLRGCLTDYGNDLAAALGLQYPDRTIPAWPVLFEIENSAELDGLPFELLPWAGGFLGLNAGVSRALRLDADSPANPPRPARLRRALIVAARNPRPDLLLDTECEAVRTVFEELDVETTLWHPPADLPPEAVIHEFGRMVSRADVLHLAGHVEIAAGEAPCFQLDGRRNILVTPEHVNGLAAAPWLVWINGCHSASIADTGSLATAFLLRGSAAFIGTGALMPDNHVRHACRCFYRELLEGTCLAEALRLARRRLAALNTPAWSHLRLYGQGRLTLR